MAEMIYRALRDGAVEGEHAPALTIKDSIISPFGFNVFAHILTQHSSNIILAGKCWRRVWLYSYSCYGISVNESGLVGKEKVRFSVAIDSVTKLLRHASTSAVACLLKGAAHSEAQKNLLFTPAL